MVIPELNPRGQILEKRNRTHTSALSQVRGKGVGLLIHQLLSLIGWGFRVVNSLAFPIFSALWQSSVPSWDSSGEEMPKLVIGSFFLEPWFEEVRRIWSGTNTALYRCHLRARMIVLSGSLVRNVPLRRSIFRVSVTSSIKGGMRISGEFFFHFLQSRTIVPQRKSEIKP